MLTRLKSLVPKRHPLRLFWHTMKMGTAVLWYGFPARRLTVIGITGTDGKTTTVGMTAHILRAAGLRTGVASTAFFDDGTGLRENPTHLTSISPWTLQRLLRAMVRNGCTHAVVEYSSHGLVQRRSHGTWPQVAAITNTAPEHLDYHGTLEQYRKDKAILMRMLRSSGTKVLNARDGTYEGYRSIPSRRTIAWGDRSADGDMVLWLTDASATITGARATVHVGSRSSEVLDELVLRVPGLFNLENALCALGCALALDLPLAPAIRALRDFPGIPGRMERIDAGQPFAVYVDFAVSAQAYQRTLETLRAAVGTNGRVLVLCSSCGNRMKEKRPEIGRICSRLADIVVASEDETYGEDPHAVLEEVWSGVDARSCQAHKIFDRRQAIAFLLSAAQPGDAVVICGMGPFTTFTKLEGRIPWDERTVVREELTRLGWVQENRRFPGEREAADVG